MKVFRVAEMVAAEKAADEAGWSYESMMEAAGKAVADLIIERFDVAAQQILVLIGPGNNGGDGLVTGRYLHQAGAQVTHYLLTPRLPELDKPYEQAAARSIPTLTFGTDTHLAGLAAALAEATIIIDALLGTGNNRPVAGDLALILRLCHKILLSPSGNSQPKPIHSLRDLSPTRRTPQTIIAVDCPSGLYCDSGHLDPLTLPADLTVTFAAPKWGHFLLPGSEFVGELVIADINIDPALSVVAAVPVELATPDLIRRHLPERPRGGHKGTFGKVLIVGGCDRYRGAPVLSGMGAFRTGAGLVNLAVPAAVRPTAVGLLPEASYPQLFDELLLGPESAQQLLAEVGAYRGLLVGPGIGPAGPFLEQLLRREHELPPLVIDADALNWLATQADWHTRIPALSVLTPHPGEMARLLDLPLPQFLKENRIAIARHYAIQWSQIVVLKGAHTVVAHPDGQTIVLPFANPLLGVGGSGDVLGGIIVALLGQGLTTWSAAFVGAYLHGAAGELARARFGEAGLLAREIADYLPQARRLTSA